MKQGDGMFLNTGRKVAKLFPHIQFEDMIIDNMCMQMVWKPQQFDVVGQLRADCGLWIALIVDSVDCKDYQLWKVLIV